MTFMYAILLYGQFMTFMQPYITIYDVVFMSCFSYGGQRGMFQPSTFENTSCLKSMNIGDFRTQPVPTF